MLFVATLTTIALSVLGVKNCLLIGVFAGIMNIIPYVGPLIAASFGILIGVTSNLELDFYPNINTEKENLLLMLELQLLKEQ